MIVGFFFFLSFSLFHLKDIKDYQTEVLKIIEKSTHQDNFAWNALSEVTDTYGHRILGSPELEKVCDWLENLLKKSNFENVRQDPVYDVPYWKRGEEKLEMIKPRLQYMKVLGLGESIKGEIEAEAIVVKSKGELVERKDEVKGKIVVYDYEWKDYDHSVVFRGQGGAWASAYGAVGALIKSVTPYGIYTTHTGSQNTHYAPRILTASITIEDAEMLSRMQARGEKIVLKLKMDSQLTKSNSSNVIGEFVGHTYPEEIIVLGGHIDTWDVGVGAMDDGCGFITTMNAVKVLIDLGLRPKRTIRFVAWTGEEYGGIGGDAYYKKYHDEMKNHIFAFESDEGCFKPYGFGIAAQAKASELIKEILKLQKVIGCDEFIVGGGGLDIEHIQASGCPGGSPATHNEDYFFYHHSDGDRMEVLNKDDLDLGVASIASLIYVIADMDERLPRG